MTSSLEPPLLIVEHVRSLKATVVTLEKTNTITFEIVARIETSKSTECLLRDG
jgi:hypothetical protein